MALAVMALLIAGLRPTEWTLAPTVALMMAGGAWIQHLLGLIVHPADAIFTALQLLACAVIWVCVRAVDQKEGLSRVGDVIFGALVIAGIGSTAGALVQTFQLGGAGDLEGIGLWVMSIPDGVRPAGNVAQPNEMATLLMWSMVGGVWAVQRQYIRLSVFCLLGCYLAVGLVISHSRIGLVESVVLLCMLAIFRKHLGGWRICCAYALVLFTHVSLFLNLQAISDAMLIEYRGRVIEQLTQNVARMGIYESVLNAIAQSPWWGYGMTNLAPAQWIGAPNLPPLHAYYMQSHNVFLDLLAWWGVPIGGLLSLLAIRWYIQVIRRIQNAQQCIWGFALTLFVLHALVELPHWSAAYLFPATIFAAALDSSTRHQVLWRTHIFSMVTYISVLCVSLLLMAVEYVRLERNYVHLRAEEVRLRTITEVPPTFIFTHLADYLRMGRMTGQPNVPPEMIEWMQRSVHGIPNYNTQVTHIVTLALNGRQQEALMWMHRLNSVSPLSYQEGYQRVWSYYRRTYPDLIGSMQWPKLPAPTKP